MILFDMPPFQRPVFGTFGMHNPSPASDIGAVAASTPSTVPKYAKNDPDAEIAAQHKDAELDAEDQQNLTEMHQNLSVCIQQRMPCASAQFA